MATIDAPAHSSDVPRPRADEGGLARGQVGMREVLFQSIAFMGPGAAVALVIIVSASFAGAALPLAALVAMAGCLLTAVAMGELARHFPSAGGFYTYIANAIHPNLGFLVGWGYLMMITIAMPMMVMLLGGFVAGTLQAEWGW